MSEKQRALLVISDFHLGPGEASGEYESFNQDKTFCNFLKFYQGIEEYKEVTLVINGDFFDSIQVSIDGLIPGRVYASDALKKIKKIVNGHTAVFGALSRFVGEGRNKIIFVVGNHDPALAFFEVQVYLRELLGQSTEFVLSEYADDRVRIAHGNNWDVANQFEGDRILSVDKKGQYIKFPWGSYLVIDFVSKVRERVPDIDKIKPLGAFIRWSVFNRKKDALITLVLFIKFFIKYRFHSYPDQRFTLSRVIKILRGACYSCDFIENAEEFFKNEKTGVLVAGHTHRALLHRFSHEQVYANSGTWLPILVHREEGFTAHQHRTYIVIDRFADGITMPRVRLMEWLDGNNPQQYVPSFEDVHMHQPMRDTLLKSFYTAMVVWPVLMLVNNYSHVVRGDFGFIISISSALTFLVPFMVSFVSRMSS